MGGGELAARRRACWPRPAPAAARSRPWGILAALGHTLDPLTLFIAYAVANVLGLLPITPGGVGVVEGVLVPSLVAAGVPAHLALVAVLAWRLVSFWLPIPVGALM